MALGIYEQLAWLTNKVKKLCCAIDLLKQSGAGSYRVYTALLTQSGGNGPSTTVGDETLNKGVTYTIVNLEAGDNLIPYGAPNNQVGTSFVCNQEVSIWGSPLSTLSYNSGAPVVKVLENTIGNIWFELDPDVLVEGYSVAKSDGLFNPDKTVTFFSLTGNGQILISGNKSSDDNNSIHFFAAAVPAMTAVPVYDQGIEIRVYN